jgi:hypothetical protein
MAAFLNLMAVTRYLGSFIYRFNRRFHLDTLPMHLRVPPLPVNRVLHLANQVTFWLRFFLIGKKCLVSYIFDTFQ